MQIHNENYGELEEGNQLSFTQASEKLKEKSDIDVNFYDLLNEKIIPVIEMTLKSVDSAKLNPNCKKHQFEILGYDFMIDEWLNPWLIEVNTNPCLEESSALLKALLPRMLDDTFKLTVDIVFPRPKDRDNANANEEDTRELEFE